MERQGDAEAALAELLLLHRAQIDEAVAGVRETTPVEAILDEFQASVQSLATKEPLFWELRVSEVVYSALRQRIAAPGNENDSSGVNGDDCMETEAEAALEVSKALQEAAARLRESVQEALVDSSNDGNLDVEHVLGRVWRQVVAIATVKYETMDHDDERGDDASVVVGESEDIEILTFDDDFLEDAQTTDSAPTADSIPGLIDRMTGANAVGRASALCELMQVPVFEALHCSTRFPDMVRAVVGLFLDPESNGFDVARGAKQFVYHLLGDCEDPFQFLDVYWAVLEFIGENLSNDQLFMSKYAAQTVADATIIRLSDCFRVLLLLLERIPLHWIHYPPETLAKIMISTLQLLILYSRCDTEIEVARLRPLSVLASLDAKLSWFKTWMAKTPSQCQLFLALNDSGFLADTLQTLSNFQPLNENANDSVRGVEYLSSKYLLAIVSIVLEYAPGRHFVQQWRSLLVHDEIATRVIEFKSYQHLDLTSMSSANERLFQLNPTQYISFHLERDEKQNDSLDVVGSMILTMVALVILDHSPVNASPRLAGDDAWTSFILSSMSRYVAYTESKLVDSLLKLLLACLDADSTRKCTQSPHDYRTRNYFSWYPLRDSKQILEASQLIHDRTLISASIVDNSILSKRYWDIVLAILSSCSFVDSLPTRANGTQVSIFCLWKWSFEEYFRGRFVFDKQRNETRLFTLTRCMPTMLLLMPSSEADPIASTVMELHSNDHPHHDNFTSAFVQLTAFASGFQALNSIGKPDGWVTLTIDSVLNQMITFGDVANLFTWSSDCVQAFLSSQLTFDLVNEAITTLRETGELPMATTSCCDESATSIRRHVHIFSIVRAALSSPYAPRALFSQSERNLLLELISETFSRHNKFCASSCDSEDECCIVLHAMIPLLSAIPAKLYSFKFLENLDLLGRDPNGDKFQSGVGACTFLKQKLLYDLEHVGGPTERLTWCQLYDLDANFVISYAAKISVGSARTTAEGVAEAISEPCKLAKCALLSAINCSESDPALMFQQSWALIAELETSHCGLEQPPSAAVVTSLLGDVLFALLDSPSNGLCSIEEKMTQRTKATSKAQASFPPATQRKMLNKMYKDYCQALSLRSSPTTLHAIIKQYGSDAIGCFPTTILMISSEACKNDDDNYVLTALHRYYECPLSIFVWPRASLDEIPPSLGLAEAVEWILAREYPTVLHATRLCQSSVGALIARWHTQSFWNYFDWANIAIYMYLLTLYGVDFQVYMLATVLAHLEPEMQRIGTKRSPLSLEAYLELLEFPIDFRFSTWKDELLRLRAKYRARTILALSSSIK